ncbi:MAG: GFA family protein [Rhizomicrobium sp.]|jgi:hypothetical protein
MHIDGACHCGKISYTAEIDPARVVICHCNDCQTNSGAPYRANAPAPIDTFSLSGQPKIYVKTADSGANVAIAFCGECGSALYSAKLDNHEVVNLRLGAVKQRAQLTPRAQFWCGSAMPWAMDISRIPQSPDQSRPGRKEK